MTKYHILFVLALVSAGANASDEWRTEDIQREGVYGLLLALDWRQTRFIAKHPSEFNEINPLIHLDSQRDLSSCRQGATPNDTICDRVPDAHNLRHVDRYFLATGLLHVGVSHLLPPRSRAIFQYVTIGIEAGYVAYNYKIGVHLDF